MNMRRKPSGSNGGYNNQHRRPRYQQGGGGGGGHHHSNGNRPRKNYSAMREKYLGQARDAMSSGDRVMAEYFYQHADHCYRMMMEEGVRPQGQPNQAQPAEGNETQAQDPNQESMQSEAIIPSNTSQLPAFITASYEGAAAAKPVDPNTIQNWEERDA